ncbi:MAG: hypothetical protein NFCOHLIN_00197 [Gammaproteobacteria bacterium]|nr:hypothetical protein [Gammaproteobacteria bacterium]
MRTTLILLTAALCVVPAAARAGEQEPQSADAVRAALVGNTDCGKNADGLDTCIYFGADGSMSGRAGAYTSKGRYEIKDDGSICMNWENRQWKSYCTRRYPDVSGEILAVDNGGQVQFRVKENLAGNPKGL